MAGRPLPSLPTSKRSTTGATDHGIAWKHAASDADVDAAFAVAKAEQKPGIVDGGAKWSTPCNQVKATIFNRQDFIERSHAFVPVYIDGDSPGAQRLGARFHVSGYPTMLLLRPNGEEVTRLPGEVDPARYTDVLNLGMNAARPVKVVLAEALAGGRTLAAGDWQLLAFYSFDVDQQQLLAKDQVAPTLARLAAACPGDQPATAMRLRLKALAASDEKHPVRVDAAAQGAVLAMLGGPRRGAQRRRSARELGARYRPRPLARRDAPAPRLGGPRVRPRPYERLEKDASMSPEPGRLQALLARVELARIDGPDDDAASGTKPAAALPALPAPLVADVRESGGARRPGDRRWLRAPGRHHCGGLPARARARPRPARRTALLEGQSLEEPFALAAPDERAGGQCETARRQGRRRLRWYALAFEKSEGPATRLQWGASYVSALVDLAPSTRRRSNGATAQLSGARRRPSPMRSMSAAAVRCSASARSSAPGTPVARTHAAAMARLRDELSRSCAQGDRNGAGRRRPAKALLTPCGRAAAPERAAAFRLRPRLATGFRIAHDGAPVGRGA